MNNVLFEVGGTGISIGVAAYASAAAVLLLMMTLWLTDRKKRTGQPIASGQVINGIGYGLLPMLTVLRAFQEPDAGTGTVVTEPLPLVQWLSTEGRYMYCRIEIVALLACFVLLTLWLIMRRKDFPDDGSLLLISICLWASIRLSTENYRSVPQDLFRYTGCAAVLAILVFWTVRRAILLHSAGRAVIDMVTVGLCLAIYLLTAKGILSVGSPIGDFAVIHGSVLLALTLTLITGGDLRKLAAAPNQSA